MEQPQGLKLYWIATRPFAFTASVTPVLLGTAIAWVEIRTFDPLDFFLAVIGAMTIHAVTNLLSDRYDLRKGLDRSDNYGAQNILLKGWISLEAHRNLTLFFLGVSLGIALYFILVAGTFILWLCLIALVSALSYTAPPLKLKYIGLGDLQVFLSFGTLATLGAYYVQTHHFSWAPIIYAIPVGLLVDAILHSNNYRDIEGDKVAGTRTFAVALGYQGALAMYYVLILGAYISIPVMVFAADLTPFALLTFITLPIALKVLKKAAARDKLQPQVFGIIDIETAQLHMMFGLLLTVGIVISYFI